MKTPKFVRCPACHVFIATLGPPEVHPGCVNQTITCPKCGPVGIRSTNTEVRP